MNIVRVVLGGVFTLGWIGGSGVLFVASVLAYWNNYDGLAQLAGFFFLPFLALPIIGEGHLWGMALDSFVWWGMVGVVLFFAYGSALLLGDN